MEWLRVADTDQLRVHSNLPVAKIMAGRRRRRDDPLREAGPLIPGDHEEKPFSSVHRPYCLSLVRSVWRDIPKAWAAWVLLLLCA